MVSLKAVKVFEGSTVFEKEGWASGQPRDFSVNVELLIQYKHF